jgi:hypothetical protein
MALSEEAIEQLHAQIFPKVPDRVMHDYELRQVDASRKVKVVMRFERRGDVVEEGYALRMIREFLALRRASR